MPKVGKGQKAVEYPYSEKGIKDAMAHAKRTGESVSMEYMGGGKVMPKYQMGGRIGARPMGRPMARPMGRPMARPMARPGRGRGINPRVLQALASRFKKGGKVKK